MSWPPLRRPSIYPPALVTAMDGRSKHGHDQSGCRWHSTCHPGQAFRSANTPHLHDELLTSKMTISQRQQQNNCQHTDLSAASRNCDFLEQGSATPLPEVTDCVSHGFRR